MHPSHATAANFVWPKLQPVEVRLVEWLTMSDFFQVLGALEFSEAHLR